MDFGGLPSPFSSAFADVETPPILVVAIFVQRRATFRRQQSSSQFPHDLLTNLLYLLTSDRGLSAEGRELLARAEDELARVAHTANQTLRFYRQTTWPTQVAMAEVLIQLLHCTTFAIATCKTSLSGNIAQCPPFLRSRAN